MKREEEPQVRKGDERRLTYQGMGWDEMEWNGMGWQLIGEGNRPTISDARKGRRPPVAGS